MADEQEVSFSENIFSELDAETNLQNANLDEFDDGK